MASMAAASSFIGETPVESFLYISSNKNQWGDDASWAGAVLGFTIFIVTYLFVVVAIFYDAISKIREYSEMIEDDKQSLARLNYDINNEDFLKALDNRIRGIKEEEGADDQLIAEAMKLESAQYKEYM